MLTNRKRQWIAGALLALFVLSCSGIFQNVLGVLAYLEGSHSLALSESQNSVSVVLVHNRKTLPTHHHGCMANFVVLFQTPSQNDPNHVLESLTCPVGLEGRPETAAASPDSYAVELPQAFPRTAALQVMAAPVPPPSDGATHLPSLRSTVLRV